jgi:hypothetical protein
VVLAATARLTAAAQVKTNLPDPVPGARSTIVERISP